MTVADASLPLQKAIIARLRSDTEMAALVAGRVYDSVPSGAVKPYVSAGPFDALTISADEYEGSETTLQFDGWANGPESVEVKRLGRAMRAALHEAALALDENQRLVFLVVDVIRYLVEPDGTTQHAAVTLRARTEPSA